MKATRSAPAAPIATLLAAGLLLSGCGGGGGAPDRSAGASLVDGATFTMALATDPGNLDPQSSASNALFAVTQLAYDPLVAVDGKSGKIEKQLATSWKVDGTTVTLTLGQGITCADGSELTASDVKANLDHIADPKAKSPYLGTFYPAGATATADDASRTVTIKLAAPAPFVLNGLGSVPIVCKSGLADRTALAKKTSGTGPYELTEAAPGDHYTYKIRKGYTWGPDGATTAAKGMPATVVMRVVQNETTAANLLVAGQINAASVTGPDTKRLDRAGLFSIKTQALEGEQWYNHAKGRYPSDPKVRMALTQALDLTSLRKVITAGKGTAATTLAAIDPLACPGDSAGPNLPKTDVAAAKAVLSQHRGAPLTFLYQSGSSGTEAAAELAVQQWKKAGLEVTAKGQSGSALQSTIFGSSDWDIAWVPLNVNSPDQVVPFLSGAGAPDGTNFSGIDNPAYTAGVKKASAEPGTDGCSDWLAAEGELIKDADIVPFANNLVKFYGSKTRFAYPGTLDPTSIRMLSK